MAKFKIVFLMFFILTSPLFARDVTIIVTDADIDLPLEGAIVRTREGVQYICDENGAAVIQAPINRQIVIQATYPGYEPSIITIPVSGSVFTIGLRLGGFLQGRELVVEAARPGATETRTGRSIAVTAREITQTGEIGVIEDVMNTIKLLPGVNYSGMFNALPSIRGGHPGDMIASFDGFYINNPYHWGGGFSIFDPRMVQSAQLSHGVFSARYGHTISGLLEISSKAPSPAETLFELGLNTSAANFNLSIPLFGKGGLLFMGRITYYDPVIFLAKQLSGIIPELEPVNFIRKAPYIRSGAISGNYRFTDNLELSATGFFGMDGIGVYYLTTNRSPLLDSDTSIDFDFMNYQVFFTTSLTWNPRSNMLLKFTAGTGYEDMIIDGDMTFEIHNKYFSPTFISMYGSLLAAIGQGTYYQFYENNIIEQKDTQFNLQARLDYDWEIFDRLLLAAGVQELFSISKQQGVQKMLHNVNFSSLDEDDRDEIRALFFPLPVPGNLRVGIPVRFDPNSQNRLLTSSGYILGEYTSRSNRFKAELGVRLDHFILFGKDGYTLRSDPVLNPRLNIDLNILKNKWIFQSLDISAGTGLFSSINDAVFMAEERYDIEKISPNRSWTSVLGIRAEFQEGISLNIEGYYKYIFDRMYVPVSFSLEDVDARPFTDGEGMVWGIDIMLQKHQSRYWDGWLSYSYNWSKYRDPNGRAGGMGITGGNRGDEWYFPSYHRFHNLNLVLNFKPMTSMNIYVRFGLASGVPLSRRVGNAPLSYPVLIYDKANPGQSYFIENYLWPTVLDENNRTTPSLPMDVKFSIFGSNKTGKTRYEVYVAVENVLSLLYSAEGNTRFNTYTGQVDQGNNSASYEIPMPIPSFGFKISY
ncbi:MAG: TonB-dependent receptor plug domain-containing protein [Treponema sp.]|nr:TonB-dependent receptor plug domain-containing protein [Treponema sp.]